MANKKITLKDQTNTDELYPATVVSNVFDDNGNSLDTILSELNDAIGDLSTLTTINKSNLVSAINEVNTRKTGTLVRVNATTSYVEYDLSDSIENYRYFILTALFYGNIMATTFFTKEWLDLATSQNKNIRVFEPSVNATYSLYKVSNTKVAINVSTQVSNIYYCALIGIN